jgi:hypothetical protein
MISSHYRYILIILALFLIGCGSGASSQINNPTIVLNAPTSSVVAAGTTLQLRATVSGSSNTTVLWFVNGVSGGNSTVGTITPMGLYTAPNLPPASGSVVITALPQIYPSTAASVTINISFANASLTGNYVFSLNGTESGKPWAVTGSFTANADGTISNGIEDINGPAGVLTALPFSGGYLINANGQGVATFTSTQGSFTMSLTLNRLGYAVLMRNDANGIATGNFYVQLSTALTLTNLDATYILNFVGPDQTGALQNVVGLFVTDGSTTINSAQNDINTGGTVQNLSFTGSYTIGTNGPGTGTATFTDSKGDTRLYDFYIVSPTQLQFIEIDNTFGYLSGIVFQQQSVTSTTVLSGAYMFYVAGSQNTVAYGAAGGFTTDATTNGNIIAGTDDTNIGGTISSNTSLIGSFTSSATGRGTISLTGSSGITTYIYYLISPSSAFVLTSNDSANASGQLQLQLGGDTTAALIGNYALLLSSPGYPSSPTASVGLLSLNGDGALAGYGNTNANGVSSGQLSVTGTYSITSSSSTTATRGVATLTVNGGTSTNYIFYPTSNSSVIILSANGPPVVGMLVGQYF